MTDIEYIKRHNKRKKDFVDYLQLFALILISLVFICSMFAMLYDDYRKGKSIDWIDFIFLMGLGLFFFFFIRNSYKKAISFKTINNNKTQSENLIFAMNIIRQNFKIYSMTNNNEMILFDTISDLVSISGESFIVVVENNKIMFNVRSNHSNWSLRSSQYYRILYSKLNNEN